MKRQHLLASLGLLALAAQAHAAPRPIDSPPAAGQFVPFEVIVKFKPGVQAGAAKASILDATLEERPGGFSVAKLIVPTPKRYTAADVQQDTLALLERMLERDDVEDAQLNYVFELALTPSDPLYPLQWQYPNINLPSAWNLTTGNGLAPIAILDTGRTLHPDLIGRWSSLEYNASSPGSSAIDVGNWHHATHVAGIAGAALNNGIGGTGVCPGCSLLNVKITYSSGSIDSAAIINGLNWATDHGARVVNMSFESAVACSASSQSVMRTAITRAINNGVAVFAAAGNHAVNVANVSPASCPGVISVAASDRNSQLAAYSSRGTGVGITAPGGGGTFNSGSDSGYGDGYNCPADPNSYFNPYTVGAFSTWTTSPAGGSAHCYRYLSGTSMATPHAAGVAGLMLSRKPALRPDQIASMLRSTATAMPACGSDCGPGLLNAYAAVNLVSTTTTGPCSLNRSACSLRALAQYRSSNGSLVESVFAYGYLWQFDAAGNQIGPTRRLEGLDRYANGPCVYATASKYCLIDSATTLDYPGFGYLESVTAYGRYWNFDANGNGLAGNGALLSSVARYASGPCAYAASSTTCIFDTRNMIDAPEWGGLFESITAYGRYWIFDGAGTMIETQPLLNVPRYASGPCAYRPAGTTCTFDARDLQHVPGAGMRETVVAYGRYFEWDANGLPTANNNKLLTTIPRML